MKAMYESDADPWREAVALVERLRRKGYTLSLTEDLRLVVRPRRADLGMPADLWAAVTRCGRALAAIVALEMGDVPDLVRAALPGVAVVMTPRDPKHGA